MDEVVGRSERRVDERRVDAPPLALPPPAKVRKKSRLGPALALVVLILLGVGAWRLFQTDRSGARKPPQETQQVGAAKIGVGDINDVITALGNRDAARDHHRSDPDQRAIAVGRASRRARSFKRATSSRRSILAPFRPPWTRPRGLSPTTKAF